VQNRVWPHETRRRKGRKEKTSHVYTCTPWYSVTRYIPHWNSFDLAKYCLSYPWISSMESLVLPEQEGRMRRKRVKGGKGRKRRMGRRRGEREGVATGTELRKCSLTTNFDLYLCTCTLVICCTYRK